MRQLSLMMTMTMLSLWLMGQVVEGGLLEEKMTVQVNNINTKAHAKPPNCISPEISGVIPCDSDALCCKKNSKRVEGTDYCCPPGSYQYYYKSGNADVCACAIHP